MSTTYNSVPYANAFDGLREDHGVILTEYEVARISGAMQGFHAIVATLSQRELDSESFDNGLVLPPALAHGLLMALASCAEFAEGIVDKGGLCGVRAQHGTKAYAALAAGRDAVINAAKEEGEQ